MIDPNGHASELTYDNAGNVLTETDALGQTWTYGYANPAGSAQPNVEVQVCATLPEAATACSGLSPPAIVAASNATITPPSAAPPAFTTYAEYDSNGNPVWRSVGQYAPGASPATNTSTRYFLYDNGSTSQSVTIGSHSASCSATAPGRELPCATVNPSAADTESGANLGNAVTQLGYDSDGDLQSSAIPDGNPGGELAKTTWTYNNDGQVLTRVAPLGNVSGGSTAWYTTTYTYNSDALVTKVDESAQATERIWNYGYDADDNRTSVENPLTGTTTVSYDAADEANLLTDADGNATLTCYDGDGNVAQVVPPVGVAVGSLTGVSCPSSNYANQLETAATTYAYDALGERTATRTPASAGRSESYETTTDTYDAAGQLVKTVAPSADPTNDPNGVVTLDNYDAAGRLVATATGAGSSLAVTSSCYEPDGERTAVVPPDGNAGASVGSDGLTRSGYAACSSSSPYETTSSYQTASTYFSTGQLDQATPPNTSFASNRTTIDTYDAAGQLTSTQDPNGVTDSITYTPLGEIASQAYAGGSSSTPAVTDSYDANGELTQVVDGSGTSSFGYDPEGDVTSYENGNSQTVTYSYNGLGEPTVVTYPLPAGTSWDNQAYVSNAYDNAGLMTSLTDLRSTTTQFSYTADELPKKVTFPSTIGNVATTYDNADNVQQVASTTASTLTYAYGFQPSSAVATETDGGTGAGVSPTYNYDTLARVTTLSPSGGGATSYGYDRSSNLTTLPTGNYAGDAVTYDNAGELTAIAATGGSVSVTYDADGARLSQTQGSTTLASGSWNGAGELTSYTVHAGSTMSAAGYDGLGLRESNTVGSTTNHFVWDTSGSLPRLLEDHANLYVYGPSGTPVEQMGLSGGTRKYLVADALGSVRAVVNSSGTVLGSASYDAYGTPSATGVSSNTPFGFAGGYTDATGLVYLLHRYYDPQTGQFLSVDPLVNLTGQPYVYVGGDPVSRTDPRGLGDEGPGGGPPSDVASEAVLAEELSLWTESGSVMPTAAEEALPPTQDAAAAEAQAQAEANAECALETFPVTSGELARPGNIGFAHPINEIQMYGGEITGTGGVANLSNEDLITFGGPEGDDPIRGYRFFMPGDTLQGPGSGIRVLGGNHRVFEIGDRVRSGLMGADVVIQFLLSYG